MSFKGKVGFAIGTGRCGTRFIQRALETEPGVCSYHERNAEGEAFHRYCKWYDLPVDQSGFFYLKERDIKKDLENHDFSFEASAPLSLSVVELFERFGAKFVFLVRRPEDVVNSYMRKGYYKRKLILEDPDLALGYQPDVDYLGRFLGRTVPRGEEFVRWQKLTIVGKIAWYWSTVNECILKQLDEIPKDQYCIIRLEEFSFERYHELMTFFSIHSTMSKKRYISLSKSRPNKLINVPTIMTWNEQEIQEFKNEVADTAEKFSYPCRIADLPEVTKKCRNRGSLISRIKESFKI